MYLINVTVKNEYSVYDTEPLRAQGHVLTSPF